MSSEPVTMIACGGRTFDDQDWVDEALDDLRRQIGEFLLVCGGQKRWAGDRQRWIGADYQAAWWAKHHGLGYAVVPADWKRHGRSAGYVRNQQMIDTWHPWLVVAFPGGPGTADMIRRGQREGLVVVELATNARTADPVVLRPVTTAIAQRP